MHATSLVLNEPFDRVPPFKQIGIAFILPSEIGARLKQEEFKGTINMPEGFIGPHISSAVLDDADLLPVDRASVIKRKVKPPTKYRKDQKETFALPKAHYLNRTKKLSIEECIVRRKAGKLDHYASSYSVPKLQTILLRNDGLVIEGARTGPCRLKAGKRSSVEANVSIEGDDDLENYDVGGHKILEDQDENMED